VPIRSFKFCSCKTSQDKRRNRKAISWIGNSKIIGKETHYWILLCFGHHILESLGLLWIPWLKGIQWYSQIQLKIETVTSISIHQQHGVVHEPHQSLYIIWTRLFLRTCTNWKLHAILKWYTCALKLTTTYKMIVIYLLLLVIIHINNQSTLYKVKGVLKNKK
jgi:hypothetical protein